MTESGPKPTDPYLYECSGIKGCVDIYYSHTDSDDIFLGTTGKLNNGEIGFVCPGGTSGQAPTLEEAALKMARTYRMYNGLLPGENQ